MEQYVSLLACAQVFGFSKIYLYVYENELVLTKMKMYFKQILENTK